MKRTFDVEYNGYLYSFKSSRYIEFLGVLEDVIFGAIRTEICQEEFSWIPERWDFFDGSAYEDEYNNIELVSRTKVEGK